MNGAYAATALAILTALAKRGVISGSAVKADPNNPHSNRVRVNFNLNRSTFGAKNLADKDKYYQYSLYGNTTNIGDIQIQSLSRPNKGNELGLVMGWAEIVCLKDVSVWCDTGHMKKFHTALMDCQKKAADMGLNFYDKNNDKYLDFVANCIEEYKITSKDNKGNVVESSVTKTPFCFFEGEPLSLEQFKSDMHNEGFDFNAPSGLAKFNPRNPSGQPPIFLFDSKIDPKGKGNDISEMPAIVGAKYVCMLNTVETKFSPVYVWGPIVCSQDMVWNKKTTKLKNWEGRQKKSQFGNGYTNKVNTYDLYTSLTKKRTLPKGYSYISKTQILPQNYRMRDIVEQKTNKGVVIGYKGPLRPYIQNKRYSKGSKKYFGSFSKSNSKTPLHERQKIIKRAKEIFNRNFSHLNPSGNGMCVYWSVAAAIAGTEFGRRYLIQAGDSQWKFIPDHLDDGYSANYFGYVFNPNDLASIKAIREGKLPEMHAWVVDADNKELIDMSSFDFPAQAKRLQGYDWLAPKPPEVYWVTFEEEMNNRDTVYIPKEQVLMGFLIPFLVSKGYIRIGKGRDGRAYIFAGSRIV